MLLQLPQKHELQGGDTLQLLVIVPQSAGISSTSAGSKSVSPAFLSLIMAHYRKPSYGWGLSNLDLLLLLDKPGLITSDI